MVLPTGRRGQVPGLADAKPRCPPARAHFLLRPATVGQPDLATRATSPR